MPPKRCTRNAAGSRSGGGTALPARPGVSRVAADWRPEGWLADFDHLTPQIAEERVTNARDALNALHRVQAISESEQEAAAQAAMQICRGLQRKRWRIYGYADHALLLSDRDKIPIATAADTLRDRLEAERLTTNAATLHPFTNVRTATNRLAIRQSKIVAGENSGCIASPH